MADIKVSHDPLMTAEQAAEYLQLGQQTIRNMASAGQLPKVKIGRSLRFRLSDLNRWVDARRQAEATVAA